jgi:hypothetical protein
MAPGAVVEDPRGGAYAYVAGMPTVAVDPGGTVVIYLGATGKATGPLNGKTGATVSVGGVIAFGAGFNAGVAFTAGFLVQPWSMAKSPGLRPIPFNLSVAGELGIYPGVIPDDPYDSVCDYAGPFGSLSADVGNFGLSVAWAVNEQLLDALAAANLTDLRAALGRPVGFSLSAGWSLIPGYGASIVVTSSVILTSSVCCK